MGDFDAIHAKLAYQTMAYFCHRIDWCGQNSAETSATWGLLATSLGGHHRRLGGDSGRCRRFGARSCAPRAVRQTLPLTRGGSNRTAAATAGAAATAYLGRWPARPAWLAATPCPDDSQRNRSGRMPANGEMTPPAIREHPRPVDRPWNRPATSR